MDIKEIVSMLNSKEMSREEVIKSVGISNSTLTRHLRAAGYKYDGSTKQYYVAPTNNEPTNVTTIEPKKKITIQPKIEPIQEYSNIVRKRASFDIDVKLLKELKIYAIQQDQNVYEIVEAAIRQYLKG